MAITLAESLWSEWHGLRQGAEGPGLPGSRIPDGFGAYHESPGNRSQSGAPKRPVPSPWRGEPPKLIPELLQFGCPEAGIGEECSMAENAPAIVERIAGGASAIIRWGAVANQKYTAGSIGGGGTKDIAAVLSGTTSPDMASDGSIGGRIDGDAGTTVVFHTGNAPRQSVCNRTGRGGYIGGSPGKAK